MRRRFRSLLEALVLGVCVVRSMRRLWAVRQVLRRADRIIVMPDGGFGHTITGPDVARRLYKKERVVFVALERNPHNRLVALLWPDIDVVFLPMRCRVLRGKYDWSAPLEMRERVGQVLTALFRRCTSADVIMGLPELYDRVAAMRYIAPLMAPRYTSYWMPAWAPLLSDPDIPRVRLPERLRVAVWAAIARFAGVAESRPDARLCCLYLRAKGAGNPDMGNLRRSSGLLENYTPTIQYLVGAGYVVLVTGDRSLLREWKRVFEGRVVCAEWLSVDPRAFSLFAHTEADIWIGQQGGPCVLPVINHTAMLVVDAFPFGNALPNAWMHYKTVREPDGSLVHYSRLFNEYAYNRSVRGLCNNSAEEILAAVREFVESPDELASREASREILESAPDHVLTKHVDCLLSPAWLRLFEGRDGAPAGPGSEDDHGPVAEELRRP